MFQKSLEVVVQRGVRGANSVRGGQVRFGFVATKDMDPATFLSLPRHLQHAYREPAMPGDESNPLGGIRAGRPAVRVERVPTHLARIARAAILSGWSSESSWAKDCRRRPIKRLTRVTQAWRFSGTLPRFDQPLAG